MNTEKLNKWLTLGANVGVVVGLIILIVEVRQNAALTRLSQETARAAMLMQAELSLSAPAAADAWMKAIHAPEDLTDGELRIAETQLVAVMQQWDTLLSMEKEGLVDRARVKMHIQNTAPFYFGSRFAKRWWEREEVGWSGTSMFEVADPIVAAVDPDFLVETYAFLRAPFGALAKVDSPVAKPDREASRASDTAAKEEIMQRPSDIEDFASRYAAAWSSQDPAAVAASFAPTGKLTVNGGPPAVGRAAIADVARSFMTAFPDLRVAFDRLSTDGGRTVFNWTLTGTNTGPDGTGAAVDISGAERWLFTADGLIADSIGSFDADDYERQLNAGPAQTD